MNKAIALAIAAPIFLHCFGEQSSHHQAERHIDHARMEIEKETYELDYEDDNNNTSPNTEVDESTAYFMSLHTSISYNAKEIKKTFERHILTWKESLPDDFAVFQYYPQEPSSTLFSMKFEYKDDFDKTFDTKNIKAQVLLIKLAQAVRYISYDQLTEQEEDMLCTFAKPIQIITALYVKPPKRKKLSSFAKLQNKVNKKLMRTAEEINA